MRESRIGVTEHGESEKRQHGWKLVADHATAGTQDSQGSVVAIGDAPR